MPVKVAKQKDRYRLVEADSRRIAKNAAGTAIDGGGHRTRKKAEQQAKAVNRSLKRKGKI